MHSSTAARSQLSAAAPAECSIRHARARVRHRDQKPKLLSKSLPDSEACCPLASALDQEPGIVRRLFESLGSAEPRRRLRCGPAM